MSDGRYTRLLAASDEVEGGEVVLKFPKPGLAADSTYRALFLREAWVGARVHSPWIGRVIEQPTGRQTRLYTVMPLYEGELLETRLARSPDIGLEEGRAIAIGLARALSALHRVGIIHRDLKPDNVILERAGSLKLIDLGAVRIPGLEELPPKDIPGPPGYMAPEMFVGEPGNEATDIYALGITMFRAFTGEFPYGDAGPTSHPHRERPKDFSALRPDLPSWLQAVLGRAIASRQTPAPACVRSEPPWYGPVCPVVWEGRRREASPYPDHRPRAAFPFTGRNLAWAGEAIMSGSGCAFDGSDLSVNFRRATCRQLPSAALKILDGSNRSPCV